MASRFVISMCLGLLVAGVSAGCVVSPQPSPPVEVTLDGGLIGLRPGVELTSGVIGFEAGPGAVDPPEGVVVITNLDADDAPSMASVQKDGSFAIAVPGQPGQRFRFQAKLGSNRSTTFDIAVDASGQDFDPNADAATACITLDPESWIALDGAGDAKSIVIRNACSGAVAIDAPHLRRGLAGFSFSPTSPIDLAAGEVATITVHAGDGPEMEDVLLLDVTAPAGARRAITLTVPDR